MCVKSFNNKFIFILKKKVVLVYLCDKLFMRQPYIKNKVYTLFFILHFFYKLGLLNKIYVF